MSVLLLLAAMVFGAHGVWWVSLPALFAGVVIGGTEMSDTRRPRPISQLRRRQLDAMCRHDTVGDHRGRRHG